MRYKIIYIDQDWASVEFETSHHTEKFKMAEDQPFTVGDVIGLKNGPVFEIAQLTVYPWENLLIIDAKYNSDKITRS